MQPFCTFTLVQPILHLYTLKYNIFIPLRPFSGLFIRIAPVGQSQLKVLKIYFQGHCTKHILFSFFIKTIFYWNLKVVPCTTDTLSSCTQRYTFQDHDMNTQWMCRAFPSVMADCPAISKPCSMYISTILKSYVPGDCNNDYLIFPQCHHQMACHFKNISWVYLYWLRVFHLPGDMNNDCAESLPYCYQQLFQDLLLSRVLPTWRALYLGRCEQ